MNEDTRVKEIDELFKQIRKNAKQFSNLDIKLIKEKENQLDVILKELSAIKINPRLDVYLQRIASLLYDEIKMFKNFDLKQLIEEIEEN